MHTSRRIEAGLIGAAAMALAWAAPVLGQGLAFPTGDGKTHVTVHEVDQEPMDPISQERRIWLAGVEKELRKLRAQYFRSIRNTEIRQVGIAKLQAYNDPAVWPTMLDVFDRDDLDVKTAILDMFFDAADDEGDASLAWVATFDRDEEVRAEASKRLNTRLAQTGEVSNRVRSVIAHAMKSEEDDTLEAAADLANRLTLIDAIPALINAQISGTSASYDNANGDAALAYIMVGQQVAFVSDLTPVVGDSAVAFDPTISVATDGVVLRVVDAVVVTYRTEIHNALVDLSSRAWGRSTRDLGWNQKAWHDWYEDDFKPYLAEQRRRELAERAERGEGGPG